MKPSQPDLIHTTRISYTLSFTSTISQDVFNLLDLFDAKLLSFGYPTLSTRPSVMDANFIIPSDSLQPLLNSIPYDPHLPDYLKLPHHLLPKSPTPDRNVPF